MRSRPLGKWKKKSFHYWLATNNYKTTEHACFHSILRQLKTFDGRFFELSDMEKAAYIFLAGAWRSLEEDVPVNYGRTDHVAVFSGYREKRNRGKASLSILLKTEGRSRLGYRLMMNSGYDVLREFLDNLFAVARDDFSSGIVTDFAKWFHVEIIGDGARESNEGHISKLKVTDDDIIAWGEKLRDLRQERNCHIIQK